eukprot:6186559-Pyramimonas_sp.AAC.1
MELDVLEELGRQAQGFAAVARSCSTKTRAKICSQWVSGSIKKGGGAEFKYTKRTSRLGSRSQVAPRGACWAS